MARGDSNDNATTAKPPEDEHLSASLPLSQQEEVQTPLLRSPSHVTLSEVMHQEPTDAQLAHDVPKASSLALDMEVEDIWQDTDAPLISHFTEGPGFCPPSPRPSFAELRPPNTSLGDVDLFGHRQVQEDRSDRSGLLKAQPSHHSLAHLDNDMFSTETPIPSTGNIPVAQRRASSPGPATSAREHTHDEQGTSLSEQIRKAASYGASQPTDHPRGRGASISSDGNIRNSPLKRGRYSLSLPPDTYARSHRAQRQREATPLLSDDVRGHGTTTYSPISNDRVLKLALRDEEMGSYKVIDGSLNGKYLEDTEYFKRLAAREWKRHCIDQQHFRRVQWVEPTEGTVERQKAARRRSLGLYVQTGNTSEWMNETWGPTLAASPEQLRSRRLSAQYSNMLPASRRDSTDGPPQKVLKKEHKRFTSTEAAERQSAQTPAPEALRSEDVHDGDKQQRPRNVILHGPKRPQVDVEERCITCDGQKRNAVKGPAVCSKCGRHQFCSQTCKDNYSGEHCSEQCRQEYDAVEQHSDVDDYCVTCLKPKRSQADEPVECRKCHRPQFCSQLCREAYAHTYCSEECCSEHEAGFGEDEDAPGEYVDAIDSNVDNILGGTLVNDPCDYEGFADIPASPKYDELQYSVVDHRMSGKMRRLDYQLEDNQTKKKIWASTFELDSDFWTSKLKHYWNKEPQKTVRRYIETQEDEVLDERPCYGRFVSEVEIIDQRNLCFIVGDYVDHKREDNLLQRYGMELGEA